MRSEYSLYREKGRAKPTIPEDIINSQGWSEETKIEWRVSGNKILPVEGDQLQIHHTSNRYCAYCPAADNHEAFKKAEQVEWGWNKKGVPYMKPVKT